MQKSTHVSLFSFSLALLLEFFTQRFGLKDLRLFVGVFIVLGLAFMIYSIKEYLSVEGYKIFPNSIINSSNNVESDLGSYFLKHDQEYLWIENSIFLNWENLNSIFKFILGFLSSVGKEKPLRNRKEYYRFKVAQDSYIEEDKIEEVLFSNNVEIIDKGDAFKYYSDAALKGVLSSYIAAGLFVLFLIIYILIQVL